MRILPLRNAKKNLSTSTKDIATQKLTEQSLPRRQEYLRQQAEALNFVAKIKIQTAEDLSLAIKEILRIDAQTILVERVSLWLYGDQNTKITCIELYEQSKQKYSYGFKLHASEYSSYFKALEENRIIAAHDACADPRTKEFKENYLVPLKISSMLDAPVHVGGKVVGVLCHEHVGPTRHWFIEEENFAASIADFIALALEQKERRLAEEALRQREEQLRLITDSLPVLISYIDQDQCYQFTNAAYEKWFGISTAQIQGQHMKDVLGDKAYEISKPYIEQALKGEKVDYEAELPYKHGGKRYVNVTYVPQFNDNQVMGFHVLVNDLTERYKVEQRLKVQYAVNRILAESGTLSDALSEILKAICKLTGWEIGLYWEVDLSINKIHCIEIWHNPTIHMNEFDMISRSVQFSPGEGLPGKVWDKRTAIWIEDFTKDNNFPRGSAAQQNGLRGGMGIPIQSGKEVLGALEFFSSQTLQPDQGLLDLMTAIGFKLGQYIQRKKDEERIHQYTEELLKSNKGLQEFAYVASHDLQEPLRVVSGYVQLLSKQYRWKFDVAADEYMTYIVQGIDRMHKLIQDLLLYSRLQSPVQLFRKIDMNEICEQAIENLKISIEENKALITHTSLPRIYANQTQMIQLFQNLIGNAIKFKRPGVKSKVHISAENKGGMWIFSVEDNGVGIEPEYFDRIFDIFRRLHSHSDYAGTGIGLAICKKIIEYHHGQIWVQSILGKGSTFYFSLPENS
ncbi:MAG: ATP-binding protein [Candidatus Omnitrophica bacterium]|nr:ATP-binding protein [Candidatus Omnitrophota bacterium]